MQGTIVAYFLYDAVHELRAEVEPETRNNQNHHVRITGDKNVRVVTWWGYLSDPKKIAELEQACNARIKVTEYTDTDEFLTLIQQRPYEIYIYPGGYQLRGSEYNFVASKTGFGPDVSDIAHRYHPVINQRYFAADLNRDTFFFQLDASVVMYDSKLMPDLSASTLSDVFAMAKHHRLALVEDFQQLNWLFQRHAQDQKQFDAYWDELYRLVAEKQVFLSYFAPEFARSDLVFGYLDGGEAQNPNADWAEYKDQQGQKVRKAYALAIHPNYSHISLDLMSIKSMKPQAECVGRMIASREFLDWVTQTGYYFSPYGDVPRDEKNKPLTPIARAFAESLGELSWLEIKSRSQARYYSNYAEQQWRKITLLQRQPGLFHELLKMLQIFDVITEFTGQV